MSTTDEDKKNIQENSLVAENIIKIFNIENIDERKNSFNNLTKNERDSYLSLMGKFFPANKIEGIQSESQKKFIVAAKDESLSENDKLGLVNNLSETEKQNLFNDFVTKHSVKIGIESLISPTNSTKQDVQGETETNSIENPHHNEDVPAENGLSPVSQDNKNSDEQVSQQHNQNQTTPINDSKQGIEKKSDEITLGPDPFENISESIINNKDKQNIVDELIVKLISARKEKRIETEEKLEFLKKQKQYLIDEIKNQEEIEKNKPQNIGANNGGRPSLFSMGFGGKNNQQEGITKKINELTNINQEIQKTITYGRVILDRKLIGAINSGVRVISLHAEMNEKINDINQMVLNNHLEGGSEFFEAMDKYKTDHNLQIKEVWNNIYDQNIQTEEVKELRKKAFSVINNNEEFTKKLMDAENILEKYKASTEKFTNELNTLIEKHDFVPEYLTSEELDRIQSRLQVKDSLFSRPDGKRIDDASSEFSKTTEQLVEKIKSIIEKIKAMLGGARASLSA